MSGKEIALNPSHCKTLEAIAAMGVLCFLGKSAVDRAVAGVANAAGPMQAGEGEFPLLFTPQ